MGRGQGAVGTATCRRGNGADVVIGRVVPNWTAEVDRESCRNKMQQPKPPTFEQMSCHIRGQRLCAPEPAPHGGVLRLPVAEVMERMLSSVGSYHPAGRST